MAQAIDTTTTTTPDAQQLRAEALAVADRCDRSVDAREQFELSERALALWRRGSAPRQPAAFFLGGGAARVAPGELIAAHHHGSNVGGESGLPW